MKRMEVVCVVIHNERGELLIAKRKSKTANGIWEFPGGKVEMNESKEAACIRELQEELNVRIKVEKHLLSFCDTTFTPVVHMSAFYAHMTGGELQLNAHSRYAWVTPDQLYAYSFQEADRVLLDALQNEGVTHQ